MQPIKILDNLYVHSFIGLDESVGEEFERLGEVERIEFLASQRPLFRKVKFNGTSYEFFVSAIGNLVVSFNKDIYPSFKNHLIAQLKSDELFSYLKKNYEKMLLGFWELEDAASRKKHFKSY